MVGVAEYLSPSLVPTLTFCVIFLLLNTRETPALLNSICVSYTMFQGSSWHNTTLKAAKISRSLARSRLATQACLHSTSNNISRGCCVYLSEYVFGFIFRPFSSVLDFSVTYHSFFLRAVCHAASSVIRMHPAQSLPHCCC